MASMTHALLARCSAAGPADLPDLARRLHEAGCSAAAWLIEAAAERLPELEARIENLEQTELPEAEEKAYEEGKADGYADGQCKSDEAFVEVLAPLLRDLDALLDAKGAIKRTELRSLVARLSEITYPTTDRRAA